MSENETRPSQNAFDSETRLRPSKSGLETGLETETNLEYYNTSSIKVFLVLLLLSPSHMLDLVTSGVVSLLMSIRGVDPSLRALAEKV